jgi:hypothetical protein
LSVSASGRWLAQPNFSNSPDDPGGDVELPALDAVAGAGRVGVVQVVPGLAHGQDRQRPEVRGLVPASNGRSPIMWQIELTDQVTWCSTATRTSPAQKNAVSAPHQDR